MDLAVRKYQSIEEGQLDLDGLTVVVGPSNSGKSAFVRALRSLVENVSSPAHVRKGEKTFEVGLWDDDLEAPVWIERGKGESTYGIGEEKWTKAGTSVPDEVALQLAIDSKLQIAGQFDPPFLLNTTGSEVARVLGELTNATTLYEAAREANRRRQSTLQTAQFKKILAGQNREQLRIEFSDLKDSKDLLDQARKVFDSRIDKQIPDIALLTSLLSTLGIARQNQTIAQQALEAAPDVQQDHSKVVAQAQNYLALQSLLSQRESAIDRAKAASEDVWVSDQAETEAKEKRAQVLKEAGVCPTCGAVQ